MPLKTLRKTKMKAQTLMVIDVLPFPKVGMFRFQPFILGGVQVPAVHTTSK